MTDKCSCFILSGFVSTASTCIMPLFPDCLKAPGVTRRILAGNTHVGLDVGLLRFRKRRDPAKPDANKSQRPARVAGQRPAMLKMMKNDDIAPGIRTRVPATRPAWPRRRMIRFDKDFSGIRRARPLRGGRTLLCSPPVFALQHGGAPVSGRRNHRLRGVRE